GVEPVGKNRKPVDVQAPTLPRKQIAVIAFGAAGAIHAEDVAGRETAIAADAAVRGRQRGRAQGRKQEWKQPGAHPELLRVVDDCDSLSIRVYRVRSGELSMAMAAAEPFRLLRGAA